MLRPKPYRIGMTAENLEVLLASIPSKIDRTIIRTTLANADDTTIPTTKAVQNALDVISGDFSSLGDLAFSDDVDLSSNQTKGVTPISKGGTGATTLENAQSNLGIITQTEIENLIDSKVPAIQEVDLGSSQATGTLPLGKGGTGGINAQQARDNIGVYSKTRQDEWFKAFAWAANFDFTAGGVLTDKKLFVYNAPNGKIYKYVGSLDAPITVVPGTNPVGNSNWSEVVLDDHARMSNRNTVGAHDAIYSRMYSTVADAVNEDLSVGSHVGVRAYSDNSKSGVLFFKVVAGGTGLNDGGKYINMTNGNQLMQNIRWPLNPMQWGAVEDIDAVNAIDAMVAYFKTTIKYLGVGKNYDAGGASLDFSGQLYYISRTVEVAGIDNIVLTYPSFRALPGFTGDAMLKITSIDNSWYVENVTLDNPYMDANWEANNCIEGVDYLNIKVIGGKLTHYRSKGIKTYRINVAPHELNLLGTFIFQKEYNEIYPVGITDGQAFEIDNFDNNFTNVIVGYQYYRTGTLISGANMFSNCHFYTGSNKPLVSLDTADDFNLCYFDGVDLKLNNRSTVSSCYFYINADVDNAIELTSTDPYAIQIKNCRFRKPSGANTPAIKMKTVAEGRTTRPSITENFYDGCQSGDTSGLWFITMNASPATFTIPDRFLPISNIGQPTFPSFADFDFKNIYFSMGFNKSTNAVSVVARAVSGGSLVDTNLGGKQVTIPLNK